MINQSLSRATGHTPARFNEDEQKTKIDITSDDGIITFKPYHSVLLELSENNK